MMETNIILQGDCIEKLKELPENCVDSIVTDPPYGLEFMGKEWDKFKEGKNIAGGNTGKDTPYARSKPLPSAYQYGLKEKNQLQQFCFQWAKECLRVLKSGGFLLSFGGTRTYHRMVCGIEDAGFEIRDCIQWLYGRGFPKSLNIGKSIDKLNGKKQEEFISLGKYLREKRGDIPQNQISKFFPSKTGGLTGCVSNWELGLNVPTKEQWVILKRELQLNNDFDYIIEREEAEREVIGKHQFGASSIYGSEIYNNRKENKIIDITLPATLEAKQWEGWGTALKPANEPIVVARKPLSEKNVALNVLKWGTGGINIDGCRIGFANEVDEQESKGKNQHSKYPNSVMRNPAPHGIYHQDKRPPEDYNAQGRFPANIILDEEAAKVLDEQSGRCSVSGSAKLGKPHTGGHKKGFLIAPQTYNISPNDMGGASRFFYVAKSSKSERNVLLDKLNKELLNNLHPTVKPIQLMQYLIRLVTPPKGIVLDPFMGSGTTAIASLKEGFKFVGIEKNKEYIEIANTRLKPFLSQTKLGEFKQ